MTSNTQRSSSPSDLMDQHAVIDNPWHRLRQFTQARIALGRAGAALPTQEVLNFGIAHAAARDAIETPLDPYALIEQLDHSGVVLNSQATDRTIYLRRPDLGRILHPESHRHWLEYCHHKQLPPKADYDIVFVLADGLSPLAVQRHAVNVIAHVKQSLHPKLSIAPPIIALQARVALGDAVAELINAKMVVVFIGERPGLSSPDSLGIYLTYPARIGCHDAQRNCISNVRPEGLSYALAAFKLNWLIDQAFKRHGSGITLKDESDLNTFLMQSNLSIP